MDNAAAFRIVEIQKTLNAKGGNVSGDVYALQAEQRRLWDEHFAGRSYEEIQWDSWAHRRPE